MLSPELQGQREQQASSDYGLRKGIDVQAPHDTPHHSMQQFYPPSPGEAPLHIDSVLLSSEQKDLLLRTGICGVEDPWDARNKISYCYRCGYRWRATNALSAPLNCRRCSSANWNMFALFSCRLCNNVFASATGIEPYQQYPQCPNCNNTEWLPTVQVARLEQSDRARQWRHWALSVLGSFAITLGIAEAALLLDRYTRSTDVSPFLLLGIQCLISPAFLIVPIVVLYRALTGKFVGHWVLCVVLGGLFLLVPVLWVGFGK